MENKFSIKDLDKKDKNLYSVMRVTFVITIAVLISLFTPFGILSMLFFTFGGLLLEIGAHISFIFGFVRRYKNYNGNKIKGIFVILILIFVTSFLLIKGILIYNPLPSLSFVVPIEAKVSEISNDTIREFVKYNIEGDKYIYNIKASKNFETGSIEGIKIEYDDNEKKTKDAYLYGIKGDKYLDFKDYIKNKTIDCNVTSKKLIFLGIICYTALYFYAIYEFKRITLPS